ncbi:hypothetical protein U1Q18_001230, partial [Sarracenia purpurea var. burkii]
TGEKIDVWKDKWIPRPTTLSVISSKIDNSAQVKVADLIIKEEERWDSQKLQQLLPLDSEIIEAIPLSMTENEDTMA